jgi:hypothetical protein
MAGVYDTQIRRKTVQGGREIKASANYSYIVNGITLDGSKFGTAKTVFEGQCLVREDATGKYVKYPGDTAGAFPAGYSNPVVLDQSVTFQTKDDGTNPDAICGQVITRGDIYRAMTWNLTDAFEAAVAGAIRFV